MADWRSIRHRRLCVGIFDSDGTCPVSYTHLDVYKRQVSIDYGKTYTEEFTNTRLASLVIKKIDEYTNEPLSGVKFLVEKQNGEYIGEYTTDSTGTINVPTLEPDWYIVRELKTKDGYILCLLYTSIWCFLQEHIRAATP